ncbi:MAG: ASKHA domain-containing protein [Oscillospiraceae bacterium]
MFDIKLPNEGVTIKANEGEVLYDILTREGFIDAPCGGKGVCGKCGVTINGEFYLSCLYQIKEDISVYTAPKAQIGEIVSNGYRGEFAYDCFEKDKFGIAVDIGTTTLVATLVDMSNGKEICSLSKLNSQKSYGQDVITRIHFTLEHKDGLEILQHTIIGDLQSLLEQLYKENKVNINQICRITIGGNTTMIHLLMGANPSSIAKAPFEPLLKGSVRCKASDLGLLAADDCELFCLPSISSFVGGDITAGILACNLANVSEKTLFIDIGTNGEIVLSDNGKLSCCSCAAGPALEGMNISCGMRAAYGAIEDVNIAGEKAFAETIGKAEPLGVCGSGLLSAIAEMRKNRIINKLGRLQCHNLVEMVDGKKVFMICAEEQIYITQKDIRQVQLAKGAILSGILALLNNAKLEIKDIERVIVAGQFGAHLKAESLTGSGILPFQWADKIFYAGNTSQSGAYICLMSEEQCRKSEKVIENIKYIELSTLKGYEDLFVECLSFEEEKE